MFEFMQKYRMLIIVLIMAGMFGFGAWAAIGGLFGTGQGLDRVIGSFTIPGTDKVRKVTVADIEGVREGLRGLHFFQRPENVISGFLQIQENDLDLQLWDYLVLREGAIAAGLEAGEAEGESFLKNLGMRDADLGKFKQRNEASFNFLAGLVAAQRFRDLFREDPGGPELKEVYERYRLEQEDLKGRYVVFDGKKPEDFDLDLAKEEDLKVLEEYWTKNPRLKAQQQIKEQIDVEVAYVRLRDAISDPKNPAPKSLEEFTKEFDEKYRAPIEAMEARHTQRQEAENAAAKTENREPKILFPDDDITDEKLQGRWTNHRVTFQSVINAVQEKRAEAQKKAQDEENTKAKEEGREPKNLSAGDQESEFDIIKERIRQEIRVANLLRDVLVQAKETQNLEEPATKASVTFGVVKELDQIKFGTHPDFGSPRAWSMIIGQLKANEIKVGDVVEYKTATEGTYLPRIFDEPGNFLAVFRLVGHREARDPELSEVRAFVLGEWRKSRVPEELAERAKNFRDAIDKKVAEKTQDREKELEAEMKAAVEKELGEASLSRENPEHKDRIVGVENRHKRDMDQKLAEEKAKHEATVFAEVAAELKLEVREAPWIKESKGGRMVYTDQLSEGERLNRFLRSMTQVRGLEALAKGRVSQPLKEVSANMTGVWVLDDRREPTQESMLADKQGLVATRMGLMQRPGATEFRFETLKKWFKISAPRLEKSRERSDHMEAVRKAEDQVREQKEQERRGEGMRRSFDRRREELEKLPIEPQKPEEGPSEPKKPEDAAVPGDPAKQDREPPSSGVEPAKKDATAPSDPAKKEETPDPKKG